ncbi:MAG: STAS/SEC14 domain-containing protein [Planctomycetota bacterium]|nr:STAS/SEC14 domain-containing protein [Planctomycetota bacterium]
MESFPGWDSFLALVAHLKFVREHHKKVSRIASATDSPIGTLAEHVASHFVNAEIKNLKFSELESSRKWVLDGGN